jgi:hypothetical protein
VFDVYTKIRNKGGEQEERLVEQYIDGLGKEFFASPEGQALRAGGTPLQWAAMMMQYAADYEGDTPPEMSVRTLEKVVFSLFPCKVSTPASSAPEIVAELRAVWSFLQRQYSLPNATKMLARLTDAAVEELRIELANPANYGMAKSFVMQGQAAGYDMSTQEGLDAFMEAYNARILSGGLPGPGSAPFLGDEDYEEFDEDLEEGPAPAAPSPKARAQKRKEHKRQRQARKRNRRK